MREDGGVTVEMVCDRFAGGSWVELPVDVPAEMQLTIYLNRRELVSVMCSPSGLNHLVLGFLYGEGIITGLDDVALMRVCEEEAVADVRLHDAGFEPLPARTLTSGCGGGTVFRTDTPRVDSELVLAPEQVRFLMQQLQERMESYRDAGGLHTSALAGTGGILVAAQDIGRHNTLDKIQGECLVRGVPTRDRVLLTTGRVSSEMLRKAARMQTPVVISRHSATAGAVFLAREAGITLVRYTGGGRLLVYSHSGRLARPARADAVDAG
jgi:FdhD protein